MYAYKRSYAPVGHETEEQRAYIRSKQYPAAHHAGDDDVQSDREGRE